MSSDDENIDYKQTLNVTDVHAAAAREKGLAEPRNEPFPLFVFVLCAAVLIAAGSFLPVRDGFSMATIVRDNYVPEGPAGEDAAMAGPQLPPDQAWVKAGQGIYGGKGGCIGCHQSSGMGAPGLYPPLAGSEWVVGSDERLAMIVLHGLTGPLVVKGTPYNGAMPPQGAQLSDAEIAQVMSYIRTSWGNEASLVTEARVANARQKYSSQTGSFTQSDLEAVPQDAMLEGPTWDEWMAAEERPESPSS